MWSFLIENATSAKVVGQNSRVKRMCEKTSHTQKKHASYAQTASMSSAGSGVFFPMLKQKTHGGLREVGCRSGQSVVLHSADVGWSPV